ncbi:uncharacterized protein G2W53_033409 [Senna tora]|uniref:Uncharacterized protein n=1 Tax=Senna tora TaxID=362788 RepID=A0A834W8F5_9FABA|nr:uncharacterized protein G2W53_033409 [Senna tora]
MGFVIIWKVCEVMSKHILDRNSRLNPKIIQDVQVNRVVAQVSHTNRIALYLGIRVDCMPEWDS